MMDSKCEQSKLVLVTGSSGFTGTHIVQLLLNSGFSVRAAVKCLQDDTEVKPLKDLVNKGHEERLELIQTDLLDAQCWFDAVKDCSYVIHTECPSPNVEPADEDDVMKPAVEGTLNILKACQGAPSVRRVVYTGDIHAILKGYPNINNQVFSEKDWVAEADEACLKAYMKGKAKAEKVAWDFVEAQKSHFDLVSILPSITVGPILCGTWSGAMELTKTLLEYGTPLLPSVAFGMCDVRDAALAHVTALESPDAAGHRYVINSDTLWMIDMAHIISNEFSNQGYRIPSKVAPKFLLHVISWFHAGAKLVYPVIGQKPLYDNKKMINELGISPRNVETSLLEMCYSMIETGRVHKTDKYVFRQL